MMSTIVVIGGGNTRKMLEIWKNRPLNELYSTL